MGRVGFREKSPFLVLAATRREAGVLLESLEGAYVVRSGPFVAHVGRIGRIVVAVAVTGVGKANTALAVGALVPGIAPRAVISVGVAGAYPGTGLIPGDLAVATEEVYADEGAWTRRGMLGLRALGLPVWTTGAVTWYERLPADPKLADALVRAGSGVGRCGKGVFATVSAVTGTSEAARRLRRRYGAVCESMEGAAAAHGALAFGLSFGEIRGVSNPVGPRDRRSWRIGLAADRAQEALIRFFTGS